MKSIFAAFVSFALLACIITAMCFQNSELSKNKGLVAISFAGSEQLDRLKEYIDNTEMLKGSAFYTREVNFVTAGQKAIDAAVYTAESRFAKLLDLHILKGEYAHDGQTAIISRQTAIMLFSNTDCIGYNINISGNDYSICGIYDDEIPFLDNIFMTENFSVCLIGDNGFNSGFLKTGFLLTEILETNLIERVGSDINIHNISQYSSVGLFISSIVFFTLCVMPLIFLKSVSKLLFPNVKYLNIVAVSLTTIISFALFWTIVIPAIAIPSPIFSGGSMLVNIKNFFVLQNKKNSITHYKYFLSASAPFLSIVLGILSIAFSGGFLSQIKRLIVQRKSD